MTVDECMKNRMRKNVEALLNDPKALSIADMAQIMADLSDLYTERCSMTVLIIPVVDHAKNRARIKEFMEAAK